MVAQASRLSATRAVGLPALVVILALAAYWLPGASAALVYDRSAILGGEMWRLVTGHWVHFSAGHLCSDAAVLCATGWLIQYRGYRHFTALLFLSALSIGLAMLVSLPDMAFYGGLSGVAMASAIYLALRELRGPAPWLGASLFVLCVGKLLLDAAIGRGLVTFEDELAIPVPLSHLVGAVSGLVVYWWSALGRHVRELAART